MKSVFTLLSMTESSLRVQSNILFMGKFIAFCINIILPVLFVRILSKSDYGIYRFATLLSYSLVPVLTLGLNISLYYFYPNLKENRSQLLGHTFYLLSVIATIGCLIYIFVVRNFLNETQLLFGVPVVLTTLLLVLSSTSHHLFILEKKAILNAFYLICEQFVRTFCVLLPALLVRDIYLVLWGLVFYGILRIGFYLFYVGIKYKNFWKNISAKFMMRQIKYALPFGLGNAIAEAGQKIDRFIVTAIAGIDNFAIYSIASFKIPLLGMFYQSVFQVAAPKLSIYGAAGDIESTIKLWHKIIVKAALVTIPSFIFMQLVAKPLILFLYTDVYADSVLPFRILLGTVFGQMTGYGLISRAFEKTGIFVYASIYSLVIGIVLGLLMTKYFGIAGAAFSAVFTYGIYVITILRNERRILNLTFIELLPYRKIMGIFVIAFICAIPLIIVNEYIKSKLFLLVIDALIFGITLIIFYSRMNFISINIKSIYMKIRKATV